MIYVCTCYALPFIDKGWCSASHTVAIQEAGLSVRDSVVVSSTANSMDPKWLASLPIHGQGLVGNVTVLGSVVLLVDSRQVGTCGRFFFEDGASHRGDFFFQIASVFEESRAPGVALDGMSSQEDSGSGQLTG